MKEQLDLLIDEHEKNKGVARTTSYFGPSKNSTNSGQMYDRTTIIGRDSQPDFLDAFVVRIKSNNHNDHIFVVPKSEIIKDSRTAHYQLRTAILSHIKNHM